MRVEAFRKNVDAFRSSSISVNWRHFDFWLLGAVVVLTLFGITMIRSAVAGNIELTGETNLVNRQFIFALAGIVLMFAVAGIDYHYWASVHGLMYLVTFIALLILNVIAAAVFGSARWFSLVVVNIQPSEIAKIVMIMVLAEYFTRNINQMGNIKVIFRSLVMTMGLTIWIILQPNLSTSIVMLVLWFSMLWVSGLRIKHLLGFAAAGIVILSITLPVLIETEVIKEYQVQRVMSFIAPDENASYGDAYNTEQALITIGSGGLFGQGYGHGTQVQLRFLKVRWSDFIFSAMSQEFGFVGTALIILLQLFVIYRCLRTARLARDTYGALIAYGVATMLAFQAMVNIGVNLKLLPATGLTLPFVSYGGSSLFTNLMAIGLVQSVILRHKSLEF
jgi:rod shape determining protein RodA